MEFNQNQITGEELKMKLSNRARAILTLTASRVAYDYMQYARTGHYPFDGELISTVVVDALERQVERACHTNRTMYPTKYKVEALNALLRISDYKGENDYYLDTAKDPRSMLWDVAFTLCRQIGNYHFPYLAGISHRERSHLCLFFAECAHLAADSADICKVSRGLSEGDTLESSILENLEDTDSHFRPHKEEGEDGDCFIVWQTLKEVVDHAGMVWEDGAVDISAPLPYDWQTDVFVLCLDYLILHKGREDNLVGR